jgi:hypothetical protein
MDEGKSMGALMLMALAGAGETPALKQLYDPSQARSSGGDSAPTSPNC